VSPITSPEIPSTLTSSAAFDSLDQDIDIDGVEFKVESTDKSLENSIVEKNSVEEFFGEPSWIFRIEGYILDPSMQYPVALGKKFTEFVKKIVIEAEDPEDAMIEDPRTIEVTDCMASTPRSDGSLLFEWIKTPMIRETDGFELKGLKNGNLKIFLVLDYPSDKFHASKELQSALGLTPEISSKSAYLVDLWRYVSVCMYLPIVILLLMFIECEFISPCE